MARDWSEAPTMALLEERLSLIAPDNTAEMPIACAKERDVNGEWAWTVDVHVRLPHVAEYEVTGVGRTLAAALRRAYLGLNSETMLRNNAIAAYAASGIAV